MKIEIWSDIMCPFCYIGKKHFDEALSQLDNMTSIEVEFKSFQLDPNYNHKEGETVYSYLSNSKNMPIEQIKAMTDHVVLSAAKAGLKIDFEKNIPANTFNAHRLIHLSRIKGLEKEVIDALFEAHFTKGQNIEEKEALKGIGVKNGLDGEEVERLLSSDDFSYEVNQDIMESRNLGISGVPFFLFDRKYAVSGAQPIESFKEVISKSYSEWKSESSSFVEIKSNGGDKCGTDGCEI